MSGRYDRLHSCLYGHIDHNSDVCRRSAYRKQVPVRPCDHGAATVKLSHDRRLVEVGGVAKCRSAAVPLTTLRISLDLTCHSRWNIGHRPLVSIQLCLVLPPPSSSSCTCILLSVHIYFSRSLLQVSLGRPLPLWPCGVHCIAPVW